MGYKVAANARQLGKDYWENTPVLSDLMIGVFQKNFEVFAPPQNDIYCAWTQANYCRYGSAPWHFLYYGTSVLDESPI